MKNKVAPEMWLLVNVVRTRMDWLVGTVQPENGGLSSLEVAVKLEGCQTDQKPIALLLNKFQLARTGFELVLSHFFYLLFNILKKFVSGRFEPLPFDS